MTERPDGGKMLPVPGVTSIIGSAKPKRLTGWAAQMVAEHVYDMWRRDALGAIIDQGLDPFVQWARALPDQRRNQRAVRGSEIHALAERLINGETVDVPTDLYAPVESATRFLDDWGIRPLLVEGRVGNRTHWYAGSNDVLGFDKLGRVVLADYKTGKWLYDEVVWQQEAYARAEFRADDNGAETPLPAIPEVHLAVHLSDGGYEVIPLERGDDVWSDFLAMRRLYGSYKRAKGGKNDGPGYLGDPIGPPQEGGVA
jgi:hypothetical protein